MSERNPIDESILRLLEASRVHQEQLITDRALEFHNTSLEADRDLTIGGLLYQETNALVHALIEREKHILYANWFEKRRLRRLGTLATTVMIKENGQIKQPTPLQEKLTRSIKIRNKSFKVDGLFPVDSEITCVGSISQDWVVSTGRAFIFTNLRTTNADCEEATEVVPIHRITIWNKEAVVYQDGEKLDEDEYYLPLGLIRAASDAVRRSVPAKVSAKW